MNVYTHAGLFDLAGAVERLPSLLAGPVKEAMTATGTEGAHSPRHSPPIDNSCHPLTTAENGRPGVTADCHLEETLKIKAFASDCDPVTTPETDYARRDSNPQPTVPKTVALSS